MKRDKSLFFAKCPIFHQVKNEHQQSGGLTRVMDVHTLKWEDINMDFIVGLPQTLRQNYSIWVVVDRLTKYAHFIPIKSTYSMEEYSRLYIN